MNINLTHPFIKRSHFINGKIGILELLNETNKLSTFCSKLENQSTLFPNRYNPLLYIGDGFELFVEALIKLSPIDNRIGISHYENISSLYAIDTGVDGVGVGIDNKPATVQAKYRSNSAQLLSANIDHLSNFVYASIAKYGVDPASKTNMLIITTAEGLHYFTDNEMFENKIRCIGNKHLKELVDNNFLFWNTLRLN